MSAFMYREEGPWGLVVCMVLLAGIVGLVLGRRPPAGTTVPVDAPDAARSVRARVMRLIADQRMYSTKAQHKSLLQSQP